MGEDMGKKKHKYKEELLGILKGKTGRKKRGKRRLPTVAADFMECSGCEDAEDCPTRDDRLTAFVEFAVGRIIELNPDELLSWPEDAVLVLFVTASRDEISVQAGGLAQPDALERLRSCSRDKTVVDRTKRKLGPTQRWAIVWINGEQDSVQASVIVSRPSTGMFGHVEVGQA